ncbi:hypothetical protein [Microbacterium aurantiacum]|uniref:hypothetical protein n=1 Tax=Microbacterium aurantiacum TaxID=162393 RepID=UPI000C7FD7A9|nr:hypothetical protein [Microbacterium aurantiacum]
MPLTLRVAFTILGAVTALIATPLLGLALFMGAWGGWRGLLPLALLVAYAAVTILVMIRKSWARYGTPLFPVSFAAAAVAMSTWEGFFPALIVAAVLTGAAVVLIFAPPSRAYFTREQPTSTSK